MSLNFFGCTQHYFMKLYFFWFYVFNCTSVLSLSFSILQPDMGKKSKYKTTVKKKTLNPEFNEVMPLSWSKTHPGTSLISLLSPEWSAKWSVSSTALKVPSSCHLRRVLPPSIWACFHITFAKNPSLFSPAFPNDWFEFSSCVHHLHRSSHMK